MNPTKAIKAAGVAWRTRRDWFGNGGVPVPQELAQQRTDVCLKCPYNKEMPIWEFFAGSVASVVRQQIKLKDELKLRVNGEENLHVCSICLCILSLKNHVPLKFILESTDSELLEEFREKQPQCWLNTEQQNLQNDKQINRIQE